MPRHNLETAATIVRGGERDQIAGVLLRLKRGLGRCACGAPANTLQGGGAAEQRIARCPSCARRWSAAHPSGDGERIANLRAAQAATISDADRIRRLRLARIRSVKAPKGRRLALWALLTCGLSFGWSVPAVAQVVVHTVSITADGSGDATAYTKTTAGVVLAVRYVPGSSSPLATGADITITDNVTGLGILAITNIGTQERDFWPRAYSVTTTGTAALYAAGGTNVLEPVPVANAIKVVVAQGGAAGTGTLYVYIQGR